MLSIEPELDTRLGRAQRIRRIVRLSMDAPRHKDLPVTLRNISVKGFGATCLDASVVQGQVVHLKCEDFAMLEASVRWSEGHKFGACFTEMLTDQELADFVSRCLETRSGVAWEVNARHRVANPLVDPGSLRRV